MKKRLIGLGLAVVLTVSSAGTALAGTWEQSGGVWRVKESGVYLKDTWYEDSGNWYMLGSDGQMLSGLYTDTRTGKSYLLNTNHDGTFGRMITTDGVYVIDGESKSLAFNQAHDGSFGCIVEVGTQEQKPVANVNTGKTQGTMTPEEEAWLAGKKQEASKKLEDAYTDVQGSGGLTEKEREIDMY